MTTLTQTDVAQIASAVTQTLTDVEPDNWEDTIRTRTQFIIDLAESVVVHEPDWVHDIRDDFTNSNTRDRQIEHGVLLDTFMFKGFPCIAVQSRWGAEILEHRDAIDVLNANKDDRDAWTRDGILSDEHGIKRLFLPHVTTPQGRYVKRQCKQLLGQCVAVYRDLEEFQAADGNTHKKRIVRLIEPLELEPEELIPYGAVHLRPKQGRNGRRSTVGSTRRARRQSRSRDSVAAKDLLQWAEKHGVPEDEIRLAVTEDGFDTRTLTTSEAQAVKDSYLPA